MMKIVGSAFTCIETHFVRRHSPIIRTPTSSLAQNNHNHHPNQIKESHLFMSTRDEKIYFNSNDDIIPYTITLKKPMGLILSEVSESDPYAGICISSMMISGNSVRFNLEQKETIVGETKDMICLYDVILAVNGNECRHEAFEQIMDRIASSDGDVCTLTLGKKKGSVAVQWPNGVCLRCMPGDSFGAGTCFFVIGAIIYTML